MFTRFALCGTWNGNVQEMDDFSYRKLGRVEKASLPFLSLLWSDRDRDTRDCYRLPIMLRFFNASGDTLNIIIFYSLHTSTNIYIYAYEYLLTLFFPLHAVYFFPLYIYTRASRWWSCRNRSSTSLIGRARFFRDHRNSVQRSMIRRKHTKESETMKVSRGERTILERVGQCQCQRHG